jgi:hypothetical protein
MKKALIVAIDNYPGTSNDLSECINDAEGWKELLQELGFTITTCYDAAATRRNILRELEDYVVYSLDGDEVVFCYSGHGSQKLDESGDEEDGYDETLFVYDGHILDDELRRIFNLGSNAHITCIIDSCFSGTVTRKPRAIPKTSPRKIKFVGAPIRTIKRKQKFLQGSMMEILMSAASDKQYAYDGVFSPTAQKVFKPGMSYRQWHNAILPEITGQAPQLEGKEDNKDRTAFGVGAMIPIEESTNWWIPVSIVAAVVVVMILIARSC